VTAYVYHEFSKWITGPDGPVVVANAAEEQRLRWERARNIGRDRANAAQRVRADDFAAKLASEVGHLKTQGYSFRHIADALNKRGILSARGRQWGPAQVWRLLRRAETAVATGGQTVEQRPLATSTSPRSSQSTPAKPHDGLLQCRYTGIAQICRCIAEAAILSS
jgi:hypothetical protein